MLYQPDVQVTTDHPFLHRGFWRAIHQNATAPIDQSFCSAPAAPGSASQGSALSLQDFADRGNERRSDIGLRIVGCGGNQKLQESAGIRRVKDLKTHLICSGLATRTTSTWEEPGPASVFLDSHPIPNAQLRRPEVRRAPPNAQVGFV